MVVALAGQAGRGDAAGRALAGAIDIHVHSAPDNTPRSVDAIDAAKLARAAGMRAIVLKNHYDPTAGLADLVRKEVPGIEVFGGVDLNLTVGGMNPAAVEHMTQVSGGWGRLVWMSTFDAENQVRYSKESRPFVATSRNGELLPEVRQVIGVIAKHNLVLATGHVSPDEGLMLLREGRRQGVQRMVVTHAMNPPVLMDLPRMQAATKEGAFIEFVAGSLTTPDAAGADRSLRAGDSRHRSGVLHPVVRPRPARQRAAGRRLRGIFRRPARSRAHRAGRRPDVEAEPREAPRTTVASAQAQVLPPTVPVYFSSVMIALDSPSTSVSVCTRSRALKVVFPTVS